MIRHGHAAGETIHQLAKKHKVHRRMVRQVLENAIPSEPAAAKPKRKPAKKAKSAKKTARVKKAAAKPKGDGTNKKAEVIAMMNHNYAPLAPLRPQSTRQAFDGPHWPN